MLLIDQRAKLAAAIDPSKADGSMRGDIDTSALIDAVVGAYIAEHARTGSIADGWKLPIMRASGSRSGWSRGPVALDDRASHAISRLCSVGCELDRTRRGRHHRPALVQPIAPDDIAHVLAEIAAEKPQGRYVDVAGPETQDLVDMARRTNDVLGRKVRLVPTWSGPLDESMAGNVLLPGEHARIAPTTFDQWLAAGAR